MTEPSKPNGVSALIQMATFSGDRLIQLAIVALVAFSGGGNFLTTVNRTDENRNEILRALTQINEIHSVIDDAMKRQKEINADVKTSLQREEQHSKETLEVLQRIEQKLNK